MEQKSNLWKTAMIYGLYLALILVLYSVILYVSGQTQNKALLYLSTAITIVGIIIAQINYRNKVLNGSISYKQAFGFGVAVMLFAGIITAVYTVILYTLDPSIIEQLKITSEETLLQKGMSEDQIEMAMNLSSKMMTPSIIAISNFISYVFTGAIVSLITAAFIKKQVSGDGFEQAMEELKSEN